MGACADRRGHRLRDSVKKQVDAALAIGVNVLAYATNREVKYKEEIPTAQAPRKASDPVARDRIAVATLRHPGGCNVAPRAVRNLMEAAGQQLHLRVSTDSSLISITDDALFDFPLVFMHGRNRFQLTEAEQGTGDLCGARRDGAGRLGLCHGGVQRVVSPRDGRDLSGQSTRAHPGRRSDVDAALPRLQSGQGPASRPGDPGGQRALEGGRARRAAGMEGVKIRGRWGVVFSPYDLSCALERQDSLECSGYVREDAARISLNVLLYALHE